MSKKIKDNSYGLIGWPVKQSLSPELHNHWLAQQGIDEYYSLYEVSPDELAEKTQQMIKAGIKGWNVTVPHKIAIMLLVDEIDATAKAVGAINTIKVGADGKLFGTNTDVYGFLENLREKAPEWNKDKPALILGAGGAARAAAYALKEAGTTKVYISNRTFEKVEALCADLGGEPLVPLQWQERESVIAEVSLIVNATSLGMAGSRELELDISQAEKDTVVYDIVYKPLMTKLLEDAQDRDLKVVTGFGMLVHQAIAAFKLWFDATPDLSDGLVENIEERFK